MPFPVICASLRRTACIAQALRGVCFTSGRDVCVLVCKDGKHLVQTLKDDAAADPEMISLKHFLAAALPRDFGHWLHAAESARLDPRSSWVRWNSSRIRERGWTPNA